MLVKKTMVSLMSPRLEKVHIKNVHQLTSRVRMYIDEEYLNRMIEDVRKHGILQPPILIKVNGLYSIVDGFHRIEAAKKAEMEYVDALVYDKDETDPFIEGVQEKLISKKPRPN
jgi:ParB/RepB/Spo0J family partition protein